MYFLRRGLMLALSSPSGAGKTTLAKMLLSDQIDLVSSISVTTRPQRGQEREGEDYFFVSSETFDQMVQDEALLEYAHVHGNDYGTPKKFVTESLASGKDILFDIDWQGVQQLRANLAQDLVSIFIMPPSSVELRKRLTGRATDRSHIVEKRLGKAASEMSHWSEYDYVLINDSPDICAADITVILKAERLKRRRQTSISSFIRSF